MIKSLVASGGGRGLVFGHSCGKFGCKKGGDLDEKINAALVELLNEGKIEALAAKYNVRVTDTLMAMKTAQ